jgi:hypothetical protein
MSPARVLRLFLLSAAASSEHAFAQPLALLIGTRLPVKIPANLAMRFEHIFAQSEGAAAAQGPKT